jgi:ABC-2 type transport system permease protein
MTHILVRKLLRDFRISLTFVCLLLMAFQMLWAHVAWRISGDILPSFSIGGVSIDFIRNTIFKGSGQIIQSIMGGEDIDISQAFDMMSIAYVHPLTFIILCIWAVGRSSEAIAGEIDRGTMELLLAQPLRRSHVILASLMVDAATIPLLCLSIWCGTFLGTWLVGLQDPNIAAHLRVNPYRFLPGLLNVASFVFAVSGYTLLLSSAGRFRSRVMGLAVLLTLVQFLVNVIGQLWTAMDWMRPFTVFYHYQPQPMILMEHWSTPAVWQHLGVLTGVGVVGYALAWWTFCKRDLPAPL